MNDTIFHNNLVSESTPLLFSSGHVDYNYDPNADCPTWHEYLDTTFESEEMKQALQMMFGYILSGKTDKNVGFFLIGQGGCGKSVAAHILRKLVGESRTCCLPFANLGDRFSSHLLTTHSLNLVEELPVEGEVRNISDIEKVFKMVTDGAVIPVEQKFQAPREAKATARCVFLANELPAFVDRSKGLWDRLVILPFNHRFRDTAEEKANLKYDLEQELPGIFNWALDGAVVLESLTRFPAPEEGATCLEQHRLSCDHEREFLQSSTQPREDAFVRKNDLYTAYREWAQECGYRSVGLHKFNKAVTSFYPEIEEFRNRTGYGDWLCWKRITISTL